MKLPKPRYPSAIDFAQIQELSISASSMVQMVREHVFAPERVKKAPKLSAADIMEFAKIEDYKKFRYLYDKNEDLPRGNLISNRREFTVEENQAWQRRLRGQAVRNPAQAAGCTITVANFKGGVSKTTTAAVLAQGLSLRGHSVLLVDLDPQGSLSSLFGFLPDIDVEEEMTVAPLYAGETDTIEGAIRKTYWHGIDIVAASPALHNSEFILPSRQLSGRGFQFWSVLDSGLDSARDKYDVIIIDSPPSLSYTTINALMAADGIIMPMPPSALDFASSAQFWSLCVDLITAFYPDSEKPQKEFAFIDVLLSKCDPSVGVASTVRDWIVTAYGSRVLPIEIPKTSIADTASATFGTVYDLQPGSVAAKTVKRARLAYDAMVDRVEQQIQDVWKAQADAMAKLTEEVTAKERANG